MKGQMTAFIKGLIMYDYVLFGAAFVLFVLFIILGLVLRKKMGIAIFFILLAFSTLLLAPTYGYITMHEQLFKNKLMLVSEKKLEYTEAIVVKGTIENTSKFHFKSCKITANVHKLSKNKYRNYIYQFKTIKKMSIVQENIPKGTSRTFKIIVEPFRYSKKYTITLGAKCK
ncbi:DUF2393 domain-containing protein [Sulfurimonas sp. SAG-AH-194-I05]|nr:DUF2393 domain-containing protein [Sulfurimonas sp. SAG-AH-194-I05]MDF1874759.1 DUF2393 domain-containing protein [Sulfurimonas sp. SAG-AH-194-I05]